MLNPLMLLGLAGLSLPIIIHLIQRQKLQPQWLATLQFLDDEDVANAFAPTPRDLLQLLLRCLLLGLFVMLMGRLVIGGSATGPRTLAVVVDQSLSMQRKLDDGQSLFDRHKAQVLELIDGLSPDDKLSLTVVGDRVTLDTGYLRDRAELRAIAEKLQPGGSGGLALVPAIRTAVDRLRSRRETNACVLVFSDQQRNNFTAAIADASRTPADRSSGFPDALASGAVQLLLIDEKSPATPNLSIERGRFSPDHVYVGAGSRMTAVVRNHTNEAQNTTVALFEGDQAGEQRPLSLQPGETAQIDLVHRFESPVDSACRAELTDDVLPGDNRFYLPMRMKDRRQILLVRASAPRDDQEEGLELSFKGADLLAYALNPGEALGQGSGTYIDVKRVTPQVLERVTLPMYSLIVLYGVTEIPDQSRKDLDAFVRNGGGLWLIPDRETSPLRFNEVYGHVLEGFAIGQLKRPETMQPINTSEASVQDPLLLPLLREEWGQARDVGFIEYFGVEAAGRGLIALRAANGDSLAVLVRRERGRVCVFQFDCDLESSTLPRTTAFVPLVQQVGSRLSQRGEDPTIDTLRVGEVLHMRLPEYANLKGDVKVAGPEELGFPIDQEDNASIRVEGLLQTGAYAVEHPGKPTGRKRWLTVNPVADESDLATLSDEEQTQLFGGEHIKRLPYADVAAQFTNVREAGGPVMFLVVMAFLIEAAAGAWQSRRGARQKNREKRDAL